DAPHRGKLAVKGAIALGVTGDVIEQNGRRGAAALLCQHVGDSAHFDVPMRAGNALEFAEAIDRVDPAAQAAIGAGNLATLACRERRLRHEASTSCIQWYGWHLPTSKARQGKASRKLCRHCEERSDDAIQSFGVINWIASLRSQ